MRSSASLLAHALLFVTTFSVEITIHASELVLQEPIGCLVRSSVCAIENTAQSSFELKLGASVVVLDTGAVVIREANDVIRLVKGTAWIKAQSTMHVRSEFGEVSNSSDGEFWVSRTSENLTAAATSAILLLSPKGSNEKLQIDPGLQNTLGAIDFNGRATTAVPMPIPFKDHVMRWARLFHGSKKQFEDQVDKFHKQWVSASQASAELNQRLYSRKIASVESEKAARAAKARKIEAENRELRALFRQRTLDGL